MIRWGPKGAAISPAGRPAIVTAISPLEAYELRRIAADQYVLEIGSAWGFSTVLMALAGAHVTAVDPHEDHGTYPQFMANLEAYGVRDRVDVYRIRSDQFRSTVDHPWFDLVFIDGDHTEHGARFDCRLARQLVRPGGLIAVHDYTAEHWPSVVLAVDSELAGLNYYRVGTLFIAVAPR